jgi:hypothetical protein
LYLHTIFIFQIFLNVSNSVFELESSHSENIELKIKNTTKEQKKNNDVSLYYIYMAYAINTKIKMSIYFVFNTLYNYSKSILI